MLPPWCRFLIFFLCRNVFAAKIQVETQDLPVTIEISSHLKELQHQSSLNLKKRETLTDLIQQNERLESELGENSDLKFKIDERSLIMIAKRKYKIPKYFDMLYNSVPIQNTNQEDLGYGYDTEFVRNYLSRKPELIVERYRESDDLQSMKKRPISTHTLTSWVPRLDESRYLTQMVPKVQTVTIGTSGNLQYLELLKPPMKKSLSLPYLECLYCMKKVGGMRASKSTDEEDTNKNTLFFAVNPPEKKKVKEREEKNDENIDASASHLSRRDMKSAINMDALSLDSEPLLRLIMKSRETQAKDAPATTNSFNYNEMLDYFERSHKPHNEKVRNNDITAIAKQMPFGWHVAEIHSEPNLLGLADYLDALTNNAMPNL